MCILLSLKIKYWIEFSVTQIEYPLGDSSKKGNHVYFLLIVAMSDCTIVTSDHHGSTRTTFISNNSTIWQNNSITQKTCNWKYTWLPFLLLFPSVYSIRGTMYWEIEFCFKQLSSPYLQNTGFWLCDLQQLFQFQWLHLYTVKINIKGSH